MIRRSRRAYLQLCPFCDGEAGACEHPRELLAQAAARTRAFSRPVRLPWRPSAGPWVEDRAGEVGLAWPESTRGRGYSRVRRVARPASMRFVGRAAG